MNWCEGIFEYGKTKVTDVFICGSIVLNYFNNNHS